ncbi:1101_t:CDS:2 [Ambispora gerdemannii]|uniref:1101_t:CDS:1 n=1 Tax=Ambispora gerdemannii TaxID=144530 RepID=A0A9N8ZZZ6_9GLOM|nr:1101_t:CDS:2 [Ambispora gerdemannii]
MSYLNSINYNLSKIDDKYVFRICSHCNQIQRSIYWCKVCSYDFRKSTFDKAINQYITGNQKIGSNWYENKDWITYTQFVEDEFSDDGSEDDYQEDEYELDYDFDDRAKTILSLREQARHFSYCKKCTTPNSSYDWCNVCNRKILETNFAQWNGGDNNINEFIRETQRKANKHLNYIEWVEFDLIIDLKFLAKGGFDSHLRIFGITCDPNSLEYMMVLKFAKGGDLHSILHQNNRKISWRDRIELLFGISRQLRTIHDKDVIHRDLHPGNILFDSKFYERDFFRRIYIADLGLARPCDRMHTTEKHTYGVMPYIAPEIFRFQQHSKASDIYAIGILMWALSAPGQDPYDRNLYAPNQQLHFIMSICDGKRPKINNKTTPKPWIDLMTKCWASNPEDRPTTKELSETAENWFFFKKNDEEFNVADVDNPLAPNESSYGEKERSVFISLIQNKNSDNNNRIQAQYTASHGYTDAFD